MARVRDFKIGNTDSVEELRESRGNTRQYADDIVYTVGLQTLE